MNLIFDLLFFLCGGIAGAILAAYCWLKWLKKKENTREFFLGLISSNPELITEVINQRNQEVAEEKARLSRLESVADKWADK